MQGERTSLNSVPEAIDLNQGSFPINTSMDHSSSWNSMLNPVENRLSSYMPASSGSIISSVSAANIHPQSLSGWYRGESSSGANNLRDETSYDDSKMTLGWPSSFSSCSGTHARTENWSFEPSDFNNAAYVGNQVTGRCSTNCVSLNLSSSHGNVRDINGHRSLEAFLPHTLYKSGQSEASQILNFSATSPGSSSPLLEINNLSGPSMGSWGSSCKRKTLEGTSAQFNPGGSSSSNHPVEHIKQNPIPGFYTASAPGNLSASSEPLNLSRTNRLDNLNSRNGAAMGRVNPPIFHPSSVPGSAESLSRSPLGRSNAGHQESVCFDAPRGNPVRQSSDYAVPHLPRPFSSNESSGLRINLSNTLNQSHAMQLSEERGMQSYPWNGSFTSRGGSSSSCVLLSGERGSAVHEEVRAGSSHRNNPEFAMFASTPETRNVPQDQIDWSFAPGTSASSRNHSSASRIGHGSGGRSSPIVWLPHQMQRSQTHQRSSDFTPWNPVPTVESDPGVRRIHFAPLPLDSFSEYELPTTSLAQHQSDQRSAAFLMNMPRDDSHDWRALAVVEGRHRLQIRQVLNAMRRGVHLHPEDYMLIDPFMNEFTELHDRHRDLRLDVDNMSYEELLALEERIGNVSTGLSEEKILGCMKQRKYEAVEVWPNLKPCCICQEDYIDGDAVGILDCGHEFHVTCIKEWLKQKNLCPICKTTALEI